MKQLELFRRGIAWLELDHLAAQTALLELAQKRRVAVGSKRVTVAEPVASQPLAEHDRYPRISGVQDASPRA